MQAEKLHFVLVLEPYSPRVSLLEAPTHTHSRRQTNYRKAERREDVAKAEGRAVRPRL